MDRHFEWDPAKATSNIDKHGVTFEFALAAFDDPIAIDEALDSDDYGEERSKLIGCSRGILLAIIYTDRGGVTRLRSARRASRKETDDDYR